MKMPDDCGYDAIRKNAQLNDVACAILKNVFLNYKYRGTYAEDLDLGLRLIKSGYHLALLSNTTVIHSHSRPAFYYLKRYFIDVITLKKKFNNFSVESKSASQCMNQSIVLYAGTKLYVKELFLKLDKQINSRKFFWWTNDLYSKLINELKSTSYKDFDMMLKLTIKHDDEELYRYINDLYINTKKEFNPDTSLLSSQRYILTKVIPDYLSYSKKTFTKQTIEMIGMMAIKNVGELSGIALASYTLYHKDEKCILDIYAEKFKKGI